MHIAFFIIINDKLMIEIITLILWKNPSQRSCVKCVKYHVCKCLFFA